MKKLYLTILIVAALVLGGCNLFKKSTTSEGEVSLPQESKKNYTFETLKAAIKLGIPLKCSYEVGEVEYEGYVKGKQWRGKMKISGGKVGEVILGKDNCMYSWEEGGTTGMKMCFEEDIWENEEYEQTTSDIEYRCMPTVVTDAKFTPPSNINFMDLGGVNNLGPMGSKDMENMGETGEDSFDEEELKQIMEQYGQ